MATQQDLQELLRLMTVAKVPIKDAMMRVKALQDHSLRRYIYSLYSRDAGSP